jgi:putative transposase
LELSLAMQTHHGLSARRADRTLRLSRSARHYRLRPNNDGPLITAIEAHFKDNPGHGFGLLFDQRLLHAVAQGMGLVLGLDQGKR